MVIVCRLEILGLGDTPPNKDDQMGPRIQFELERFCYDFLYIINFILNASISFYKGGNKLRYSDVFNKGYLVKVSYVENLRRPFL